MKREPVVLPSPFPTAKLTCFLLALLAASLVSQATPGGDPICGSPSSLEFVQAFRAKKIAASAQAAKSSIHSAAAPLPTLGLDGSNPGLLRFNLAGETGKTYHLESSTGLGSGDWTDWLAVVMGTQPMLWNHDAAQADDQRFFRLRSANPDDDNEYASNFRLLDHNGKARDLFYNTQLKALAVLEAGDNVTNIAPLIPLLNQFASLYSTNLQIWVLLSDPAAVRTKVTNQATALKLNFPILFDRDGLAALSVGLTHAGEVAVIQPPEFTVAYRGEVSSPDQKTAAATFLGQALAGIKASTPFTFVRTPASGHPLPGQDLPTPDYATEIAPILRQHCAICHRPNDVAPFALTNHTVAANWAPSIKHMVLSGKMPPWHADAEYGQWANDLSLPGPAKSALIRWINAGAPRGAGADPLADSPPPPGFNDWPPELGQPDALVTIPEQNIKAFGTEDYRYIFVQASNTSNVWVKAAIVMPSNFKAVHHYLVWPGQIGNQGFPGFSSYQPSIAGYVPGNKPFQFPADTGMLLTNHNWLTFNLHYTPYGEAATDRPTLALWYHKTPPLKTWKSDSVNNIGIVIPPRVSDYEQDARLTLSKTVRLHRLNPHMHLRGQTMSYTATYPNGSTELLLSVPDYDFNWQVGYELATPKILPAGTKILVKATYDNSVQNLSNPDPSATVRWGDQTTMEMLAAFMDWAE